MVKRIIVTAGLAAATIGALSIVFQSRPGVKAIMGARFRMFQANPDNQVPDPPVELSAGVAQGLLWVAHNTTPAAVLAVNDRTVNFYYSALSERAVFLERTSETVDLFTNTSRTQREQAVERLFGGASLEAICETAGRFRVDYLVNVKALGRPVLRLPASLRSGIAFENDDIGIVSLGSCGTRQIFALERQ